jgi:hypothetical protein
MNYYLVGIYKDKDQCNLGGHMARLKIIQTSKSDNVFVMNGILLEGSIYEGMQIHVNLNSSVLLTGEINEVKETTTSNHFQVSVRCSDFDEAELWQMLNLTDDELDIN